jgi:hypothetical protein
MERITDKLDMIIDLIKEADSFEKAHDILYDKLLVDYDDNEAETYYNQRELFNEEINPNIEKFNAFVADMICNVDFKLDLLPMSSYPKLNLINDSDYDLGLLVHDLDMEKLFILTQILIKNKFTMESITKNKENPGGNAYRFSIVFEDIECEVKIRDFDNVQAVIELHKNLNALSKEESMFLTYHKYQFKQYKKDHYLNFKIFIYHVYFNKVSGAFRFD